jgi:sulfate-transporting ATPase
MAAYQYVYVMKDLTKAFPGGREVFKGITLSFLPGVKIGVLGVNGAGKSTLLKIMAGVEKEYGGEAWAAEGVRIGYLEQEPRLDPDKTVSENVAEAFGELQAALTRFNAISEKFMEPMEEEEMNALLAEQAQLQEVIDSQDGWDLDRRIEIALDALRCPPPDANVTKLSGGERRRVALCRLLLEKPDLLLLDEPTNHLDAESVAWLEKTLRDFAGTVMIITHDRYFLDNVTNWILEIERGRGYPFEGNYSSWLDQKRKRLQQEEMEEQPAAGAGGRAGMDPVQPQGAADKEPRAHSEIRGNAGQIAGNGDRRGGDRDSARAAPRRPGDRGRGLAQGLWQPVADR